jgi:glucan phosphoethanolaminetransferase (alkaline phosphatase superfamily)
MNFGLSGLIMVTELPDKGYQTALSLLSIVILFGIVPVYCIIRTILLRKWPGRQLVSTLQRIFTIFTIVFMRTLPSYQIFVLFVV